MSEANLTETRSGNPTQRFDRATAQEIFAEPLASWSPAQWLEHYSHRPDIHYLPVVDAEHTEKVMIDQVLDNIFTFNGECYRFDRGISWQQNPSQDIEWLILLHKCYYFVGLGLHYRNTGELRYQHQWIALTRSWIAQTGPGFIASDVTGRRIQNWVFAFYYFVHSNPKSTVPEDFLALFLQSLHQQVSYLISNLTPARNHRTLELYAVFLAAVVFPEFRDAPQWLAFATEALADNAQTDILADGVHCELSTFYHHIVLKNLLAVKQLSVANQIALPAVFDQAVHRALEFSAWVHKPDGMIPSLSDGDSGCFYDLLVQGEQYYASDFLRFIGSQGQSGCAPWTRCKGFADSGYYILRSAWQGDSERWQDARYLIVDCGPLGAGNHGHLDLLNIEVAAYGRSLIVDPGRYTYDEAGDINWRVLFRSTEYHNTVQVDGCNQTRYEYHPRRNKFKITGSAAEARLESFISHQQFDYLHGIARSHEYTATHERKIFFAAGEYWLICDYLHDSKAHDYTLRFHLSPLAKERVTTAIAAHGRIVATPNLDLVQTQVEATKFSMEPGFVSPVYGSKQAAPVLRYQRNGRCTVFETLLMPYQKQPPQVEMTSLKSTSESQHSALHCRIRTPKQTVHDYYFMAHHPGERHWSHESIVCSGRFCYLRLDDDGQLLHAFALPGSQIHFEGKPVQPESGRW